MEFRLRFYVFEVVYDVLSFTSRDDFLIILYYVQFAITSKVQIDRVKKELKRILIKKYHYVSRTKKGQRVLRAAGHMAGRNG